MLCLVVSPVVDDVLGEPFTFPPAGALFEERPSLSLDAFGFAEFSLRAVSAPTATSDR